MSHGTHILPALTIALMALPGQPLGSGPAVSRTHGAPAPAAATVGEASAAAGWNGVARDLIVAHRSSPFVAIRGLALLSVAQYNAILAAERPAGPGARPSVPAAIGAASVAVLSYLYPADSAALEARLDTGMGSRTSLGAGEGDPAAGEAIGRAAAAVVVARARGDGFFAPWSGTIPEGPGIWSSATPPVGPGIGLARTWFLRSAGQFRPLPPPAFDSPEFLAALDEVRRIAESRTPEQHANAVQWNLPAGTVTPAGFWNEEAVRLAARYALGERQTAHLLALMNMVSFDAVVASHEAKYHYWLLRPTQADPRIVASFAVPNFPAYPSNHAALSAGMARIIAHRFPAERARFDGLAEEAARSRVLGGIHYRFDGDAGVELGRRVAAWALARAGKGNRAMVVE